MIKRITERIRKAWAESAPPSSAPPGRNPFCKLVGKLNLRNASTLREGLWQLLWQPNRAVALDCSQIRFMDGSAMAVMIEFAYTCQDRGINLRLVDPSSEMCSAFSLYGLGDVLVDIADFHELEMDGVMILLEEDVMDSFRMPPVAETPDVDDSERVATIVEEEVFADSIRLPALSTAKVTPPISPWREAA